MFITNQKDLSDFLARANKSDAVSVDTEFIRDNTYWPKLCLLQMALKDEDVLIDPFKVDVSVIADLFKNEHVVKIFHSPRQDIEILRHECGYFPIPLFDTQTAAAFLGYSLQIGYGHLVEKELGVHLKKGDSYSDWAMRPLSKSQLQYAADDVIYLHDLYYKMSKRLKDLGRLDWVAQDTNAKYLYAKVYDIEPRERFAKLKHLGSLKDKQISIAREVCEWRENYAMEHDMPRKWVLTDNQILEICKRKPNNISELFKIRDIKKNFDTKSAREIVDAVKAGVTSKEFPYINKAGDVQYRNEDFSNYDIEGEIDLMSAIVRIRAKENYIAPQVLSSKTDLNLIAHGVRSDIPTLKGWRREIVGLDLLDLMDGKISLKLDKGKVIKKCISQ
ncbi:MAG: ribonuclease D [Coriobacteriia bacterium]|nr:ribonuclease D [Coriobacteriia bacterium]